MIKTVSLNRAVATTTATKIQCSRVQVQCENILSTFLEQEQ